jgi:hypothetical protein
MSIDVDIYAHVYPDIHADIDKDGNTSCSRVELGLQKEARDITVHRDQTNVKSKSRKGRLDLGTWSVSSNSKYANVESPASTLHQCVPCLGGKSEVVDEAELNG